MSPQSNSNSYDGSLNALTAKIRAQHPGAYDDMDDAALTKAVLRKYPQYSDLAAPGMPPSPIPPKGILPGQLSRTTEGPLDPLYNTVINAGEWAGRGAGHFALGGLKTLPGLLQSGLPAASPTGWTTPRGTTEALMAGTKDTSGPFGLRKMKSPRLEAAYNRAVQAVSKGLTPQGTAEQLGAETAERLAQLYALYGAGRGLYDMAANRTWSPTIPLRSLRKPFPLRPGEQQVAYRTTPPAAQAGTQGEALKDLASEALPGPVGKAYRVGRKLRSIFGGSGLPVSEGAPYPARSVADMKPEERAAFLSQQAFPAQPLGIQSAGLGQTPVSTRPVPPPSGAQLGQLAGTEAATAPAVTSPVRTMPGQIAPQTVWQRPMSGIPRIEGQPLQRGLALPGQVRPPSGGLGEVPVTPYTAEQLARGATAQKGVTRGLKGLSEEEQLAATTRAQNRKNEIEFGLQELEDYPLGKDKARYIRREMAKDPNYDPVKLLRKHLGNLRPLYPQQWKGPKFVGNFQQGGIIPSEQIVPAAYDPFIWQYFRGVR